MSGNGFGSSNGSTFFDSWALWQKMTFVLACGIVGTIAIGFVKLAYDRYKLRKYTKADKGKGLQTPEMLESQPVTQVTSETKDDVPFGIRAIQSGIEVDGVWISRTNTPVGSSRNSIISEKLGRSYNNSQLELPQTAVLSGSGPNSRPGSMLDRNMSSDRITAENSRASSPGRGRTQPQARCANCNLGIRHSHIPQNVESPRTAPMSGPPSPRHAHQVGSAVGSAGPSGKTSRRTSDESDYMAITDDVRAYEHLYMRPASGLPPHSGLSPIDPRSDLDALATHRLSHVAETGQLTPRVRKPGHSGEWASVADGQSYMYNGVQYVQPTKTPSPPLPAVADEQEQASSSRDQPQTRAPISLSESYAPKAPYYPESYQPKGLHNQYSYDEVPYEVNTQQNQERDSTVLRTVNPGFEILRPGTLHVQSPEEQEAAERKQQKKLQKKRRESSDSQGRRQSHFTEEV